MTKQPTQSSWEHKTRVIAVIPAFNEEKYIGTIVLKTRQYVDEVIVADDGSTDQTANIASLAGATVIKHEQNKGYGSTIQTLLTAARERNPDVLVLLDADAQHDPSDIPRLIKPINNGFDLVIGSREQQRGNIPLYRRIGQRIISRSTRVLSRQKLYDTESGFRAFSRKAIATLELKENGMAISAETVASAAEHNLKITEEPISIRYTADGSTMHPLVHGFQVMSRIINMISERRPLFFFGLGGLVSCVIGLLAGIRVLDIAAASGGIAIGTALLSILLLVIGVLSIFTGIVLNVLIKGRH
ncbi:MAG: glycosyltransferase family 2 protein [Chloroflexi bacterium]|nr:glycosyltransferase family 2 protein [Chloroflexota bacterium]